MSLLDDVSIVVTPNGYKAGELYAVIPVPTEGSEEITNGDFATDLSGWSIQGTNATNTITWESNGARIISTGANIGIAQNTLTIGKTYRLTCDVAITVGKIGLDGATSGSTVNMVEGFNEIIFTAISTTFKIKRITGNDNCLLDNVSVKEYTAADMDVTRATAATRVDENGLVNYAEIIGGEEITNGGFTTDSDWTKGSAWSISGNNANFDDSTNSGISQSMVFTASKTYKVDFEITSGSGSIAFLSSNGATTYVSYATYGVGTYSVEFNYTTGSGFGIFGSSFLGGAFSITNVSVKEVTRDNVPRIDYTGGGCPHILAEPMRTNLFPYSEDFSQWLNISSTDTPNYSTAPDGTNTATRLLTSSQDSSYLYVSSLTISDATSYTLSIYVKSNGNGLDDFRLYTTTGGTSANLTATTEWQRFDYNLTSTTTWTNIGIRGVGGQDTDVLVWGAQVEVGSYPTSLIPTNGEAGGVTRNQDIFTRDGIGSLINSTEGVLFVEAATFENGADCRITLSDGTITNRVSIEWDILANTIKGFVGSNGNLVSPATYNQTDYNKIAIKYKENDCTFWINGTEVDTDFTVSVLSGVNQLEFSNYGGTVPFEGKVKQLQVYDTALTDEQLLQLTGESGTDFYESYAEMASALTYTIQ